MSHRNARTTFHARLLMVKRFDAGWAKAHIAEAMGVSRKCVHTWISRFQAEGEAGLVERSSRPHTTPTRTPRRPAHHARWKTRSWIGGGATDADLMRSGPSSGCAPVRSRGS